MRELGYLPPQGGMFISRWHHGSPAHRYGLFGLHWLTQLDGRPTPGAPHVGCAVQLSGWQMNRCGQLSSACRRWYEPCNMLVKPIFGIHSKGADPCLTRDSLLYQCKTTLARLSCQ